MLGPFATLFHIRAWEFDLLTHEQFLAYEKLAHDLMRKRGAEGG